MRVLMRYCKVVVATSVVWFLLDIILILYFSECKPKRDPSSETDSETTGQNSDGVYARIPRFHPGQGEQGAAVHVPSSLQEEMRRRFAENQFNVVASELVALNRSLADVRSSACRSRSYPEELPTTSVVIVFHNEAWSTLLRTIHSVIGRSPVRLIKEIILVDDASDREHLREALEQALSQLSVHTQLIRMPQRSGLVRARLRGAALATGDVLTFLDAHCECTEGWLPPMLMEIHRDRRSIVCPIIDVINDQDFRYTAGSENTWGGFNWKLNFRWYPVPPREMERRHNDPAEPLRTPTMAGGLFAIDRKYFEELGTYDEGMEVWGSENLEMSFRAWMCGGIVLICPCSHVGHVFRKQTPYTFPGGTSQVIYRNNVRLASVWMDQWAEFFFFVVPSARQTDAGDVEARKELRTRLQCRSFRWYLETVYPDSQMPLQFLALGEVRAGTLCLDTMGRKTGESPGLVRCHGLGGNQLFLFTAAKEILNDDLCLDGTGAAVLMHKCHKKTGNQAWERDGAAIKHVLSRKCLTATREKPTLDMCGKGRLDQQWTLGNITWKP